MDYEHPGPPTVKLWMILLDWLENHHILVRCLNYDDEGATVEFKIGLKNFKISNRGAEIWASPGLPPGRRGIESWNKNYPPSKDILIINLADPNFFEIMDSLILKAQDEEFKK